MIPDGGSNIPDQDPIPPTYATPPANASTRSPTPTKLVPPDPKLRSPPVSSRPYPMTPKLSEVPPRPSTAPPHSASGSPSGDPGVDLHSRTTLVSNLRARNLLLQKAISYIDDAVLHLMAARSGIPSSKMQQVRGEARNRKDLLDRVDRAIKMAQNGELYEENQGGGTSIEGCKRPSTDFKLADAPSGTTPSIPPNVIRPLSSDTSLDAHQLRRSSSQPQLGPSAGQPQQVPTKVYNILELLERRHILQESIQSWQKFATELRATQPQLEAQAQPTIGSPDVAVSAGTSASAATTTPSMSQTQEPSWAAKYQRAQFEIKRREDLLLRLNQAISQVGQTNPTAEQFAALATYMPPALDKPRFDAAYSHFCHGMSIPMNTTIVMPDASKPVIDVYAFHVAIMQEGSFARVLARKSWDLVGARLGFIQTAATATTPAKSSPEIAAYLEKVYRDRLQQFDHLYVSSVIETIRKRIAECQKKP